MLFQDFRFALRQLHAAPGYSAAIIVTLALGIGANTAVFSMLDGFLLRRLPYPHPERIAALVVHKEGVDRKSGRSVNEESDSFEGSSWQTLRQNVATVIFASSGGTDGVNLKAAAAEGGAIRYVRDNRVSAQYFTVLGIPLQLGREFTAAEDRPHGPSAVILTNGLWKSVFHGNAGIVGESIRLKGEPYTVVGVLPASAVTPSKADVFTPLQPSTTGECGGDNCSILVRLKRGATWPQVNAQLAHVRLPYFGELEKAHGRAFVHARPLQVELADGQAERVTVLMLAVSFILLIACGNLAGLALVRLSRRMQEIATRLALGASRWAVMRQLWVESLVLALLGACAGVWLAFLAVDGLQRLLPEEMIPVGGFDINLRVLAFTFGISVMASLLFGAMPALQTRRFDLRSAIASGSRSTVGGSSRLRQWLIGGEVALTVVLLAASGLMIRTLVHLETQPPGFDPQNVLTAKASLDDARYHNAGRFHALLSESPDAIRASLGINDVAVGLSVPYERGLNDAVKILDGKKAGAEVGSSLAYVTPAYFSTLRIPIVSGRAFTIADAPSSQPVAAVNEAFARRFFGEPSPVGRHFRNENVAYTVVAVVANVAKKPGMEASEPISIEPVFYAPASQINQGLVNVAHIWFQPSWIVRTANSNIGETMRRMQQALSKVDPDLPFSGFYSMNDILREQLEQQRIEVLLLSVLAGLALLLSAIGIYSLVSNSVVQRTREIGIRIALGSTTAQAMLRVGSSGVLATACGILGGIALSLVALRVLASELYGVQVYDPLTLTVVPVALGLLALLASTLPTLRIGSMDPADTLRAD